MDPNRARNPQVAISGKGSAVSQRSSAGSPRLPAMKRFHDLMTSAARTTSWTRPDAIERKRAILSCISAIGLNLPAHFPLCQASENIAAYGAFALWKRYSSAITKDIGCLVIE